ncbi:hypothetical protein FACS1894208_00450 [Clostridia bacterium]|nr:hypothetical protein FACS1894208_00450 [Clostridia bacterium]
MREAGVRKLKQVTALLLVLIIIASVTALAVTSRYNQSATFSSTGSPLLNPNFTSDAWNKWEMVAWGVFLSNFVVPMADTYESAFSTSAGYGSKGSGFKALDFSTASDSNNNGIMQNFLQFAIDQASGLMKPLYATYYYMDQFGTVMDKDGNALPDDKNPTKKAIAPDAGVAHAANFRDLLLVSVANDPTTPVQTSESGGWFYGGDYSKMKDIFGGAESSNNVDAMMAEIYGKVVRPPVAKADGTGVNETAFAKFPVLWVEAESGNGEYVKVWDMMDPWDFQVAITMLAKEINSDAGIGEGLGAEAIWKTVAENINKAFASGAPIAMDAFGNIVCTLGAYPYVVIPAAYNKHLTTEPTVNLVNSLFLTGATSGVSGDELVRVGKKPVTSSFLFWSDSASANNGFSIEGIGQSALGWQGSALPENAVALYFDTDKLQTKFWKDVKLSGKPGIGVLSGATASDPKFTYSGVEMRAPFAANFGVLDLDLYGNRQFSYNNGSSEYIVPKMELAGVSKAGGLSNAVKSELNADETGWATNATGVQSLLELIAYGSAVTNLLPASYDEANTAYVQDILWREATTPVFGNPVVVPVAFEAGVRQDKKEAWQYLARDFINYYGTVYYPKNKASEMTRVGKATSFADFTETLLHTDKKASAPVIAHANEAKMRPFIILSGLTKNLGFIWNDNSVVNQDTVKDVWAGGSNKEYLSTRWIKAYPTNKILTEVASYLGMRGDSEFAAAAAPWVYGSYLKIYGVDKVKSLTLNVNPTKFNEKIYNAAGSPLFAFDPTDNTNIKSDEEMEREVRIHIWKLLAPTSGGEYKRQLLSSLVGNFVYEQYNRLVFGGSLEYRSGGVQQVMTRSQTGFLRFPSLEDNLFTRWFYGEYATVALWLLGLGLVFVIIFGIFRRRKAMWFLVSIVLLVASVIVIPFTNDMASTAMDGLVSNIMKDKTTIWSISEMLANSRAEEAFLSTGLDPEGAAIATDIARDLSIVYTDRTLMLRQDISHKIVSLGNYSELQSFASTRWVLPTLLRQFSADDGSLNYLYVPLLDVVDDAANAYWWYNPKDAKNSGGISASDLEAKYAVGTDMGKGTAEYPITQMKQFYPNYHSGSTDDTGAAVDAVTQSYRSVTHLAGAEPVHNFIYMYMNNTYMVANLPRPTIPAGSAVRPQVTADNATNSKYWGDPDKLTDTPFGGDGTVLARLTSMRLPSAMSAEGRVNDTYDYASANLELIQLVQQYKRDERDTMSAEFGYIWSTETLYPYFYALVKDTMNAMGAFDYSTGSLSTDPAKENSWDAENKRLGTMANALSGVIYDSRYYGKARSNFMYQTGLTLDQIHAADSNVPSSAEAGGYVFTGYGRDVLDLESMFYNVIPYMYQMTLITGGLTGETDADKGLFGADLLTKSDYQTFAGLPQSWLYRCNWVAKIVEAPAYNKKETIGYWDGAAHKTADVYMTYFPDAYLGATDNKRSMVFSEAQMRMQGLAENDLTTLELKLIQLNKDISKKWTALLNYVNTPGLTAEVLCREMAVEALTSFNSAVTPKGLGAGAYSLYPTAVDLRSLSFDTLMKVILLNSTKNSNYFNTDAMEAMILEYDTFAGVLLLITTWVCVYGVTLIRAAFLCFLFVMGVYGIAKSVLSANNSKKSTLFGYATNIVLLFLMSFVYYFIFNLLMTGANDAAFVSTGLSGVSVPGNWAIVIILVASILYIIGMIAMIRVVIGSIRAGTGDLGFGTYKDKVQSQASKISRGIREMRQGHSYEDMTDGRDGAGGRIHGGTIVVNTGASGEDAPRKNSGDSTPAVRASAGAGSGARALEGSGTEKHRTQAAALEDHNSLDAALDRDIAAEEAKAARARERAQNKDEDTFESSSSGSGTGARGKTSGRGRNNR